MIELVLGSLITLISLLCGYQLGKYQRLIPEQTQKQINEIFKRVIPTTPIGKGDLGPVQRPTAADNFYRDNPQYLEQQRIMEREIENAQTI